MSIKQATSDKLINFSSQVGVAVMTLATVVGMLELSDHSLNRVILPSSTVKVESTDPNNPIRVESDDSGSSFVSYSQSQRTPARSGKY